MAKLGLHKAYLDWEWWHSDGIQMAFRWHSDGIHPVVFAQMVQQEYLNTQNPEYPEHPRASFRMFPCCQAQRAQLISIDPCWSQHRTSMSWVPKWWISKRCLAKSLKSSGCSSSGFAMFCIPWATHGHLNIVLVDPPCYLEALPKQAKNTNTFKIF